MASNTMFKLLSFFYIYLCYRLYGCELWDLSDDSLDKFCAAWRKGLKRSLGLPYSSHSFLLLSFLAVYHCLGKYVNVLLSLFIYVFFHRLR